MQFKSRAFPPSDGKALERQLEQQRKAQERVWRGYECRTIYISA